MYLVKSGRDRSRKIHAIIQESPITIYFRVAAYPPSKGLLRNVDDQAMEYVVPQLFAYDIQFQCVSCSCPSAQSNRRLDL